MLLNIGLNNEKSLHTLPLRSVPFHISPSLILPLQALRLISLVSLITKTKRIAERSAIVTHTHTLSHTDRQSTLGKYISLCLSVALCSKIRLLTRLVVLLYVYQCVWCLKIRPPDIIIVRLYSISVSCLVFENTTS